MLREAHLGAAAMMCLADTGRAEPCMKPAGGSRSTCQLEILKECKFAL